jgi:hypothetical protein
MVLIHPPAVPIPPTALDSLDGAIADLRTAASAISQAGSDIKTSWQGLQAHYTAPESADLLAALDPVETKGDQVEDDLLAVIGALKSFAQAARRHKTRLRLLRQEAWDLYDEVGGDSEWTSDARLVARNGVLKRRVSLQWAYFQQAEAECASAISAAYGGSNEYVAVGGGSEPDWNQIAWGVDPSSLDAVGYDLSKWEDWKRLFDSADRMARHGDQPWPLDWARDAAFAQWDNFGVGMLWGTAVSTVSATGVWSQSGGVASSWSEVRSNAAAHHTETLRGFGALAGVYGEGGWMTPFTDEWNGDTWQDNAGAAWKDVAHDLFPWEELDDRPMYAVYTGAGNVALTVVAFPVRAGTLLSRLGGGPPDTDGTGGVDGVDAADGASSGTISTHWPNGVGSRPGFTLSEHLASAGSGLSRIGDDLFLRLQRMQVNLTARWGSLTVEHGGPGGSPTGHGPAGPVDGSEDGPGDGPEHAPARSEESTGAPNRTDRTDESAPSQRERTESESPAELRARDVAEGIERAERYGNEEYLRERQPTLVGAGAGTGNGPMDITGRSDTTITNNTGDGAPSAGTGNTLHTRSDSTPIDANPRPVSSPKSGGGNLGTGPAIDENPRLSRGSANGAYNDPPLNESDRRDGTEEGRLTGHGPDPKNHVETPLAEGDDGTSVNDRTPTSSTSVREGAWHNASNSERLTAARQYIGDRVWTNGADFVNDIVDLANGHQGFFDIYYRPGDGDRWKANSTIGEWSLPKLNKDPNTGLWYSPDRVSSATPPTYIGARIDGTSEGLKPKIRNRLNRLSTARDSYIDNSLKRARLRRYRHEFFKFRSLNPDNPVIKNADAQYAEAHTGMTKASERYGEGAARQAIETNFNGETKIEYIEVESIDGKDERVVKEMTLPRVMPDPETGGPVKIADTAPRNGNDQFDQIWRTEDGGFVIVEAKSGPDTKLGSRQLTQNGVVIKNVSQGTREYFESILEEMKARGGQEKRLAEDIEDALLEGKVHYVEARGNPDGSIHGGYSLRLFNITGRNIQ